MPVLVQISIVIVTIGLLAIALLTVRMMTRFFNRAAEDLTQLTAAVREGRVRILDATCPAIYAGLQASQKGIPFMPHM